jgi:hypothetical protein
MPAAWWSPFASFRTRHPRGLHEGQHARRGPAGHRATRPATGQQPARHWPARQPRQPAGAVVRRGGLAWLPPTPQRRPPRGRRTWPSGRYTSPAASQRPRSVPIANENRLVVPDALATPPRSQRSLPGACLLEWRRRDTASGLGALGLIPQVLPSRRSFHQRVPIRDRAPWRPLCFDTLAGAPACVALAGPCRGRWWPGGSTRPAVPRRVTGWLRLGVACGCFRPAILAARRTRGRGSPWESRCRGLRAGS